MHAVMDSNVFVPLKVQLAVVPAQTRPVLLQAVVSALVEETLILLDRLDANRMITVPEPPAPDAPFTSTL
jgi:hypothetical protein